MLIESEIEKILSVGISLEPIGLSSFALTRPQAVEALSHLRDGGVGILGGDVLQYQSGRLLHNYSSWYCNPTEGESILAFVNRSGLAALEYIQNYPSNDVFFVIVPRSVLDAD